MPVSLLLKNNTPMTPATDDRMLQGFLPDCPPTRRLERGVAIVKLGDRPLPGSRCRAGVIWRALSGLWPSGQPAL